MKHIALVDDKDIGIQQIKNSIPSNTQYELYYFDSYEKAVGKKFDILLLDYYLDKDGLTGADIINQLNSDIIIGFSSVPTCNQYLENLGAQFSATKTKDQYNKELEEVFKKIL